MKRKARGKLPVDDIETLEVLAKAQEQYEEYLRITSTLSLIPAQDEPEEVHHSWDHPLTFTIKKSS